MLNLINLKKVRNLFNTCITKNKINLFTCPCCWFPTIEEKNSFEICFICNWEDDWQDDNNQFEILWWPNWNLSLNDARNNISSKLNYNIIAKKIDNKNINNIINKILEINKISNLLDNNKDLINNLNYLKNDFLKFINNL